MKTPERLRNGRQPDVFHRGCRRGNRPVYYYTDMYTGKLDPKFNRIWKVENGGSWWYNAAVLETAPTVWGYGLSVQGVLHGVESARGYRRPRPSLECCRWPLITANAGRGTAASSPTKPAPPRRGCLETGNRSSAGPKGWTLFRKSPPWPPGQTRNAPGDGAGAAILRAEHAVHEYAERMGRLEPRAVPGHRLASAWARSIT